MAAKKPTPSVKVITKSETAMKKGKLKGSNASGSKSAAVPKGGAARPEKYKPTKLSEKVLNQQYLKSRGFLDVRPSDKKAANTKGGKSSSVAPKTKTPATPPKPKGRSGRGMGGLGFGGSGGMFGRKNK